MIKRLVTMIGQGGPMQLSGANLLIASQQLPKAAGPQPQVQFAQTLAKESGAAPATEEFAPMTFKKAAAPVSPGPATAAPTQNYAQGPVRPGSRLDIRI